MITLSFPKLEKFLSSTSDELKTYERGVIVNSQHAIVVGRNCVVVCNLYDYFTIKQKVKDKDQQEKMNEILSWMDGKIFPESYWKELTKGYVIELDNNGPTEEIVLSDHETKKKLMYKDYNYAFDKLISVFKKESNKKEPVPTAKIAFDIDTIASIKTNCDCKKDTMILNLQGTDARFYHFSFESNAHIFGLLVADQEKCQDKVVDNVDNLFTFFSSLF